MNWIENSSWVADDTNALESSISPIGELHARFVMSANPMPRHERWRLNYREDRYCRHLSQGELNRRIRDIFLNTIRLTPEAKVGLSELEPVGIRWMVLWTHVLEEMRLRHGPYPSGFTREILHTEPYPDFASDLARRTASLLTSKGLSNENILIKYGEPDHMRALCTEGRFRVQSAGYYSRPGHNGAVRDDELSLQVSIALRREDILPVVKNPQDVPSNWSGQRFDVSYSHSTDYWLYCLTSSVEPRHFVDFGYSACAVIKDRREFVRRIQAVEEKYFARTLRQHGPAVYIDPLIPKTAKIYLPMSKHFRFAYQDEYRFVWQPHAPSQELTHMDVEVGSLADIAELIVL